MPLLHVVPDVLVTGANDLAAMGESLREAHSIAVASTTALIPAAADEVSTGIAQLFSAHGQDFQKVASTAATFHDQFVQNVNASVQAYARGESANAAALAAWPAANLGSLVQGSVPGIVDWALGAWNSAWSYAQYVPLALALLLASPVLIPGAIVALLWLESHGPIY